MTALSPRKYWRVVCPPAGGSEPEATFAIPDGLARQSDPPRPGDGFILASYDDADQMGLVHRLGVFRAGSPAAPQVDWAACEARIWVDTGTGRRYWKGGHFAFAQAKIADYGLDSLFCDNFPGMIARGEQAGAGTGRSRAPAPARLPRERMEPVEVVGEPMAGPRAGVVYVLRSAYGCKVGRTRSVPDRMRTFAVRLPFFYTIPLCVWFEDCEAAERRYHESFRDKRINGEWFELSDADIDTIRARG